MADGEKQPDKPAGGSEDKENTPPSRSPTPTQDEHSSEDQSLPCGVRIYLEKISLRKNFFNRKILKTWRVLYHTGFKTRHCPLC